MKYRSQVSSTTPFRAFPRMQILLACCSNRQAEDIRLSSGRSAISSGVMARVKAHTKPKVRGAHSASNELFRWQKSLVILVRWDHQVLCCPHCREQLSTRHPAKARACAHLLEGHLPEDNDEHSLNVRPVCGIVGSQKQ